MRHRFIPLLLLTLAVAACTSTTRVGPRLELPAENEDEDEARDGGGPDVAEREDGFFFVAFPTMGTRCELTLGASDREEARAALQAVRAELARIDAGMSEWRADSEISKVNAAAGLHPVAVDAELFELVARSLDAAARTGGAFDPTWAGMRGVWRFGDSMDGVVPSEEAVEEARALVDYRKVRLDPEARTIFLEQEKMALGLGGIAKGYAVDRLVGIVRGLGLHNFVIKLGGDLYAAGRHSGRPWVAGIQDPRAPERQVASLAVEDRAFSTSGDYERYFEKGGVRYHHIIDPSTGRPATASRSVTALCPDATTAEVVTKPVFIFGPARGIPYATSLGCEVAVIDAKGERHVSPGLEDSLVDPE